VNSVGTLCGSVVVDVPILTSRHRVGRKVKHDPNGGGSARVKYARKVKWSRRWVGRLR
jgi:hypothetical protein